MTIYSPLAISERMIANFVPTRLYIKRHAVTGIRYLGKTIHEDITSYKGSGTRWTRHIKKHGPEFVVNDWVSDWFTDPHDLQEFALFVSEEMNIVESNEWANVKPEYGVEGNRPVGKSNGMYGTSRKGDEAPFFGKSHSSSTKELISSKKTGTKMSDEFRARRSEIMSSDANPMSSAEHRKTLSEARLKTPKKECPHCGVHMDPGNYAKHHGDKCGKKPLTEQ